MTKVIQPIFEQTDEELLAFTKQRFFTMFTPIQEYKYKYRDASGEVKVKTKYNDFAAYVANPFIDSFLEPAFALDAAIHLLNAIASLAKALYTWSLNQQKTKDLVDAESAQEFHETWSNVLHTGSMLLAQTISGIFSFISLFTRPIASVMQELSENEQGYSPLTSSYRY